MHSFVRKLSYGALLLPFAAALLPALHAQEDGPPNVLVIHREYLKPGKGGMVHERSEGAFVQAFADSKSKSHYFALDSLSGPSRTLFLFGYDSFAEWEKQVSEIKADKALAAKVDQASLADGDLLASYDLAAMALRADLSLNKGSIEGTRFFEITTFVVKPGRTHEFTELAHLVKDAYQKITPQTHWDCFELMYGNVTSAPGGNVFIVVNTMKSLAETDQSIKDGDKFDAQLGEAGMQKMRDLEAASVEASATNLFVINPRESNPYSAWTKKEPAFWKGQ